MPPVSPDGGFRFAKTITDLYADAVAHLLGIVAQRLADGITQRDWAEQKLSQMLTLRRDAQRLVGRLGDEADAALYELLADAYANGVLAAGGPGVQAAESALSATNRGAVQAYAAELAGTLRSTHTRILRSADDVYRRVIGDVAGQAVTGVQTRREIAARAVSRYASAGITGFTDRAGRNWELGSYVEMATRTATGQAHVQGGLDRYVQQGRTLVIVSDVPEECEKCRPFEGKILSLNGVEPTAGIGRNRYAGSLADARSKGFLHPNCRHAIDAFVPGLTELPPRPTADPEGDRLRQQQRALERAVRESKRRVAAADAFGDTAEAAHQRKKLRERREALSSFIAEHDRKEYVSRNRTALRYR